jgi:hypothetical protein
MSIGRTKWTTAEIALLHKLWPVQGKECVAMFPSHTPNTVKTKASILGLVFAGRRKYTDPLCHVFKTTRTNGSGQITPPTYRHQLMREALQAGPVVKVERGSYYGRRG